MNYYERHLGDYSKDTAHLTMIEHGAYGLLLDRYYSTEAGIPADQVHRVARARSKEEKQAVDVVLDEFFRLVDGVWINRRAEEEIEKAQAKINAAKENGKKGGRPKGKKLDSENETQPKPTGLLPGSENETQPKAHQTPDTRHQTPEVGSNTPPTEIVIPQGKPGSESELCITPGQACLELRKAGIADTNPGHPDLIALCQAGATLDEFRWAAAQAQRKKTGFSYAVATLVKQRERTAARVMHKGRMPNQQEELEAQNQAVGEEWERKMREQMGDQHAAG